MIQPQAFYKQVKTLLKPFRKIAGDQFIKDLENELRRIGLDNYAETVSLAHNEMQVKNNKGRGPKAK